MRTLCWSSIQILKYLIIYESYQPWQ
jgi:hypothetical protein